MPDFPIYLIRHGQTEWNAEGRFQGRLDSALTSRGEEQARHVGDILMAELEDPARFDYRVSPLGRTMATARLALFPLGLDYCQDPELVEIDVGAWAGQTYEEVAAGYPDLAVSGGPRDFAYHSPDGESLEDLRNRGRRWLESITVPTVAITHGGLGFQIRGAYLGLSAQEALELPETQGAVVLLAGGNERIISAPAEAKAGV